MQRSLFGRAADRAVESGPRQGDRLIADALFASVFVRLKIAARKSQVISSVFTLDYPSAAVTCTSGNSGEFGFG